MSNVYLQTKETYVKAFQGIKDKLCEFDFIEDISAFRVEFDFEKAVHNAASRVFPSVAIKCCYFILVKPIGLDFV